ncbi:MAG: glutathione ABC transporter substrate-binding protein [Anaerolineales bacterium]|nr:glutathione ABC transporter substrate-binding protein [Anaerolineales bacterium]
MKSRTLPVFSLLVIVALLLAACGGTPTTTSPTQPAAQPTEPESESQPTEPPAQPTEALAASEVPAGTEAPAATEASATGGNLIYVLPTDIASLDPHALIETVSGMVDLQMFETLLALLPDGSVGPRLATEWSVSDDNLRWTLKLREGVVFHDGEAFDANAAKANFDRILNPDNALPAVRVLAGVTEVNVIDDFTLEIVTQAPFGPLPFHLAHYSLAMVSPRALQEMTPEELAQNPVGTGPFRFVSYTPNESIVLERFDDYWGEKAKVDMVTFRPIPETAGRALLIETGEAHIAAKIAPQDVDTLRGVDGLHVDVNAFPRVIFVHMNESHAPLDDVRVRQALSWAVDREAIANDLLRGLAVPATGPVGSGVFGYSKTENYGYDPDRARELLAEAGVEGLTLKMLVPAGRYQGGEEAAQAVQAQLANVGVTVDLEVLEFSTLLQAIRKPAAESEWDLLVFGFIPATNDADWQVYSQFHCDSQAPVSNNFSYYCSEEMDALLEQGRFTMDQDERLKVYKQVIQLALDDAIQLYLFENTDIYAVRNNVQGLVYMPIDYQFLNTVSLSGGD